MSLLAARPKDNMTQVFNDGTVAIYELADAAPYAQTSDPHCELSILSRTHMRTECQSPAQLSRLEMFDPGWHARVNGLDKSITLADGRFQMVSIPAGTADIIFSYEPDHILFAWILSFSAMALWVGLAIAEIF